MMKFSLVAMLFFLLAGSAFSQDKRPVAIPAPAGDGDVVRISTNLIQLDVTVTDKKGQPVTDLRRDEIEIYENGKKKNIAGLSFVRGTRSAGAQAPVRGSANQTVLPAPPIRPGAVRRTVAIVVDDLNLSFPSTFWVREALKKFINEQIQEGDVVAIVRSGAGVGALQQFTADRRQLLAAVDRVKWNSLGSGKTSFFSPARDTGGSSEGQELDQLREEIFAAGTLGAVNFVVRGMKEMPGRKSVVLLSDGISLYTRDKDGRPALSRSYYDLQRLIDFANRSSVVLYAIHAEGLSSPGPMAVDDLTGGALEGGELITENLITSRLNQVRDSQDGLRYLADSTGGFAIINNNNIPGGLRRIMDDQSYYLVAYDPDEDTFDPKKMRYNNLVVKVLRPETRVRYRTGFFSISEEQTARRQLTVTDSIISAITSPFSISEIDVRMNAIFMADARQGLSVHSFINIDPAGLTFTEPVRGMRETSFDIVAYTFGVDGRVLDERSRNFTVKVDANQYRLLGERGLITAFSLPVKSPGGYQVRLAVRDAVTAKLGSVNQFVEVPSIRNRKLVLSGMVLSADYGGQNSGEDPLRDTSVRQFRPGTALQFSYFVYNAKLDRDQKPRLVQTYKLYRDNQPVFSSSAQSVPVDQMPTPKTVGVTGGIVLGAELLPGDYVLQVNIIDGLARGRQATQFVQFEIGGTE